MDKIKSKPKVKSKKVPRAKVSSDKLKDKVSNKENVGTWERPKQGILSKLMMSEIRQGISHIVPPGFSRHQSMMDSLLCPDPYIGELDPLLNEAWNVLEGQVGADIRFRDALDTIRTLSNRSKSATPIASEMAWANLSSDEGMHFLQETAHKRFRANPAAIKAEHGLALFFAARLSSGNDWTAFARGFDTLMSMFCGLVSLRSVHRAARSVISGVPGSRSHMERLLGLFGTACGPDDGPALIPDNNCHLVDDIVDSGCLREIISGIQHVIIWEISDVQPPRACPGEEISIHGFGFGNQPKKIFFSRMGTVNEWIEIDSESWSEEEIVVKVPQDAGCGLRLGLPVTNHRVCGRNLNINNDARTSELFHGTAAEILNFSANDSVEPICVAPGEDVLVSWRTCAADDVTVWLLPAGGSYQSEESEGTWVVQAPSFGNTTTKYTARIRAQGTCAPTESTQEITVWKHKIPDLSVDGIEVNQAIQHYRAASHLTDAVDQGADNSLQLVVGKTALVRVYLRSGQDPNFDAGLVKNVTATLRVERIIGGAPTLITTLNPINTVSVDARADFEIFDASAFTSPYDAERGNINATLNFIIPASAMSGRLRLTAQATVVDPDTAPCGGGSTEESIEVDIAFDQTLNMVGIPVSYIGPEPDPTTPINPPLAAPTVATFTGALGETLAMLPVNESPTVRVTGTVAIDYTLDGERMGAGGCSFNWYRLLSLDLLPAMIADGNSPTSVYFGLIPTALPATPGGCASFGVTGGKLNQSTIAHETTHILGLSHTPCGNVGDFESDYPAYEPYDASNVAGGRIGEYGFDSRGPSIIPPTQFDFMSYCNPDWISIYTHERLINPGGLTFTPVSAGSGFRDDDSSGSGLLPMISVIANMLKDVIDVHIARLPTRAHSHPSPESDVRFELLNDKGEVVSSAMLMSSIAQGNMTCGQGSELQQELTKTHITDDAFIGHALLADPGEGSTMRLLRGKNVLWQKQAPKIKPSIVFDNIDITKKGISIGWKTKLDPHASNPVVWLRWQQKDAEWKVLAVGLSGDSALLDADLLPSGDVQIQALLHDGFYTASTESELLNIASRPASVAILHPGDGEQLIAGRSVRLWASVTRSDGTAGDSSKGRWLIDGKLVGRDSSIWISAPKAGKYRLEYIYQENKLTKGQCIEFSTTDKEKIRD